MYTYIKQINTCSDTQNHSSECDFSNVNGEVSHPNEWIIYKEIEDGKPIYTLCIDYLMAKDTCVHYGLSRYIIVSSSDNIILETTNDKSECTITTEKYKYQFKVSENIRDIQNTIGGVYKAKSIEIVRVEKISHENICNDKYHLELDDNVLSFYIDGVYVWSKIISLKYTSGIYFVLKDKVFTVIENGCRILDVFNLDGSLYKHINVSIDYIEHSNIIYSDNTEKYLKLDGFVWHPVFLKQYIDVESIFTDKMKQKTISEYDDEYNQLNDSDIEMDDLVEDQ